MYWKEDDDKQDFVVPDDIVDLNFRIDCKCLPLDHAHALSRAVQAALPWMADVEQAGIHQIHGAESGNGWMRPEDPENELLYVSRRTRMSLRLPKEHVEAARELSGHTLDIDGYPLGLGEASVRKLSPSPTIFSRYVVCDDEELEEAFVQRMVDFLQGELDIPVRKILCGRSHYLRLPQGRLHTRSVMLADLDPASSVRLQEHGLGPHRLLGCGLFLPHKGIASLDKRED